MKQEAKPPLGGGNSSVGVPEEELEPSNHCECKILSPLEYGLRGTRTLKSLRTLDFKSNVYANSTIRP